MTLARDDGTTFNQLLARYERVIEISQQFPNSIVRLNVVGDKVIVSGQAHDIQEAAQILKLVVSNTPGAAKIPSPELPNTPRLEGVVNPAGVNSFAAGPGGATPGLNNYLTSGSPSVINMLRVAGVQQVMLKVVVAEVNSPALEG